MQGLQQVRNCWSKMDDWTAVELVMRRVKKMGFGKALALCAVSLAASIASLAFSGTAWAQSHSYINLMRSSTNSHYFIQQSVDGEFGRYRTSLLKKNDDGSETQTNDSQYWKGFGIGTNFGVELMKFVQVVGGHTFVNMRRQQDALESLNGSRLNAGLRLVFLSPVSNLEAGAGLQGSRLDYRKQLDSAALYGSGVYYSLGMNYFLGSHVSVYYEAKLSKEHMVKSGGSSDLNSIDTDMTTMGLGFRIWM